MEPGATAESPKSNGKAWPRVHIIYFALAAFDLIAVVAGLYLSHHLGQIIERSSQSNRLWQGNYDSYWYLPIAPCAALTMVMALTWWRPAATGAVVVLALLAAQPSRIAASDFAYRMKEYGPLLRGTRRIAKQTKTLRRLETSFPMPPFSDETFLFGVLGGQLRDDAEFDAVIDERGAVRFTRVAR